MKARFSVVRTVCFCTAAILVLAAAAAAQKRGGVGVAPARSAGSPASTNTIPRTGGELTVVEQTDFSFTPSNTGIWTFRTSNNGNSDPYLWLFNANWELITEDDDGGQGSNALITVPLTAGTQYHVRAGFYNNGTGTYRLSVTSTPVERLSRSGGNVTVDGQTYYSFTPNNTALWTFVTSNNGNSDPYLWLYNADWQLITEDDDGGEGQNALIIMPLTGGTQYFIRAGFHNDGTGVYRLNVSSSPLTIDEIPRAGGNITVNEMTFFTFTPNSTGSWTFVTSNNGNSDPYLWLYDGNWQLIAEDDDGGDGNNALITSRLINGTQYFVRAGFYSNGTGKYTLQVSR
ncbi:MAG: DVUA0089 family protein [Chitinispirillales bacterium]|nr:DVUA0089 family protein [Chitinispirillales bacterium]